MDAWKVQEKDANLCARWFQYSGKVWTKAGHDISCMG